MAGAAQRMALYDPELADLPPAMRWREWMGRVEAAIFAASDPVPREALAKLVGRGCRLDELIAEIREELKGRPYDLVFVAGGWQHRTRPRFADAIRAASAAPAAASAALTRGESFVLTAIAYLQPATRAEISGLAGREIGRDVLARLKQLGLIAAGPRVAAPGAPLSYVTTSRFLSLFGFASLRDLPDREAIEEAAQLERETVGDEALDAAIGLGAAAEPLEDE